MNLLKYFLIIFCLTCMFTEAMLAAGEVSLKIGINMKKRC